MKNTEKQLIEFFKQSGASDTQSATMASQMIKRSGQLSVERGWTETQAMEYLLKLFVEAQQNQS